MVNRQKGIAPAVSELILPYVNGCGCELWDVEYVKEGARRILRVTIDKPEGVTIDDCESVHRTIDPVLDEADPIPDSYYLEVSSPGVERELRKPEHFKAYIGQKVEAKLFAALNGSKSLIGELDAFDPDADTVTIGGVSIGLDKVSCVRVCFDFGKN